MRGAEWSDDNHRQSIRVELLLQGSFIQAKLSPSPTAPTRGFGSERPFAYVKDAWVIYLR